MIANVRMEQNAARLRESAPANLDGGDSTVVMVSTGKPSYNIKCNAWNYTLISYVSTCDPTFVYLFNSLEISYVFLYLWGGKKASI